MIKQTYHLHHDQFRAVILGSPNVGKSTLFNVLTDTRDALVKNQPGVTRDIHKGQVQWDHHSFEVIDTGGLTKQNTDKFSDLIRNNIQDLIPSASCLIVVMDAKAGLNSEALEVVNFAHQTNKPFLIVINKVDSMRDWDSIQLEFCQLGKQVYPAAFEKRIGISEILDWIISLMPSYKNPDKIKDKSFIRQTGRQADESSDKPVDRLTNTQPILALIGRPNVGKSSLCNRLHGLERMLVTEIPGTTTDSIDSLIEYKQKSYTLIDTAGIRRRSQQTKENLEILASYKTKQAINRADVILLLIDGLKGPGRQDAKLVDYALELHKPVILLINKTDLAESGFRQKLRQKIKDCFHFFSDIPIIFISAKTGLGLDALFTKIEDVWKKLHFRIPTSQLNSFFTKTIAQTPSPFRGHKPVKFYYLTQTKQIPPSFIAFTNRPEGLTTSYKRFLVRKIKQQWSLSEIPIRIFPLKKKSSLSRN